LTHLQKGSQWFFILSERLFESDYPLQAQFAKRQFDKMDTDGDGKISFQEFAAYFHIGDQNEKKNDKVS